MHGRVKQDDLAEAFMANDGKLPKESLRFKFLMLLTRNNNIHTHTNSTTTSTLPMTPQPQQSTSQLQSIGRSDTINTLQSNTYPNLSQNMKPGRIPIPPSHQQPPRPPNVITANNQRQLPMQSYASLASQQQQ
ncbi:hypothetical protein Glove_21g111 [Diversispora epigaea]|uniref:Uncharacterized protein n=1 Tax=Diversispora epigaea TaxID=1348612 RepID=A0A397JLP3_9GLOM|nr:hypothetical protein Glove_21g111 [Diversispora epigaea]